MKQNLNEKKEKSHLCEDLGRGKRMSEGLSWRRSIADHSVCRGPSSQSERPVGNEVQHIGPTPTYRFPPVGNQALIVPRPL